MLIIYISLQLGGIETFFLRLAKTSANNGKILKFLILSNKSESNQELISELSEYAEVYFFYDLFKKLPLIGTRFFLLNPFKNEVLNNLIKDINTIHVATGQHALLANRILKSKNLNIPITVGVYHGQEFCWNKGLLPYFEKINRKFVFEYISDKNILCFSENTKDYMAKKTNYLLTSAKTFRLGVINDNAKEKIVSKEFSTNKIRMCAVGRLVQFKTYNIWMSEVVKNLKDKNIDIVFDIYGEGPLRKKIESGKHYSSINLKGQFDYSNFNEKIKEYDLFIGSGTAIIQASALGVPSIIGIESIEKPYTYGYFSEFYEYEYHSLSLDLPKIKVEEVIENFFYMSNDEKKSLSRDHILASNSFTMDECYNNFIKPDVGFINLESYMELDRLKYYTSKVIFYVYCKIFGIDVYSL